MKKGTEFRLHFPVKPKGKQSFRYTEDNRKYQPKDIVDYKKKLREMVTAQLPKGFKPFGTDAVLQVTYSFQTKFDQRTPAWLKRAVIAGTRKLYNNNRPDVEQLMKNVNDALESDFMVEEAKVKKHRKKNGLDADKTKTYMEKDRFNKLMEDIVWIDDKVVCTGAFEKVRGPEPGMFLIVKYLGEEIY